MTVKSKSKSDKMEVNPVVDQDTHRQGGKSASPCCVCYAMYISITYALKMTGFVRVTMFKSFENYVFLLLAFC